MQQALRKSLRLIKARTPKETGRMASGWKLWELVGSPKGRVPYAARIYNVFAETQRWRYKTRKFAARSISLETKRVNTKRIAVRTDGRLVLRVLEYGSRPHLIRPAHVTKKGQPGYLAFKPRIGGRSGALGTGDTVFTRLVRHPGTKPYGMIRRTQINLEKDVRKINLDFAKHAEMLLAGQA
ncbi:MAG: hypothetical protein GWN00_07550 [Aliifodinibius sp.]|nr:hypothetical protein [Fodinibius sp.]NIW44241.1 hypothetical protein [Gammaproteobacteria bacterium]NIX55398.1 hypothetical protein [candidate division Zixibacteria bacterium]NIY24667.1 hypothetical protein [Fodinibius sp.]